MREPLSPLAKPRESAARKPRAGVLSAIGRTPLVRLERYRGAEIDLWAKLEGCNPGGSAKARPATQMIADALAAGRIGPGDLVIESTSGNMGIGLAQACAYYGLSLICVVDSRANELYVKTIQALGAEVRAVSAPDPDTGDLLTARLRLVERLLAASPGAFWPNQYANESNPAAHAAGTMREIDEALDGRLDYLFVAASTAGTVKGCTDYIDRHRRATQVVAVDAVGSVLFGGARGPRRLPGLGAGTRTELALGSSPHRIEAVTDLDCVVGCRRLAAREAILAGASSGGVLRALDRIRGELPAKARCAVILPDGGTAYLDTVFDDAWVAAELGCGPERLAELVAPRGR